MITAEQWYEQEVRYNKYGFDMKPKAAKEKPVTKVHAAVSRKHMFLLLAVAGMICIGLIICSAYAASITYTNNQIRTENAALQGEVESLQIKIQTADNIDNIEQKATKELGMVYPDSEQYVTLSGSSKTDVGDFASLLKKQAYN